MITKFPTAAVTPLCRLLFPALDKPRQFQLPGQPPKGDPEFSTLALIARDLGDPKEKALWDAVKAAINAAIQKKWPGRNDTSAIVLPLKNGDDEAAKRAQKGKSNDATKGCIILRAKAKQDKKPLIVGPDNQPITDLNKIYSGVWARLSINFGGTTFGGTDRVTAYLNHVRIVRDGPRIGGISVEHAFAGITDEGTDMTVGANVPAAGSAADQF